MKEAGNQLRPSDTAIKVLSKLLKGKKREKVKKVLENELKKAKNTVFIGNIHLMFYLVLQDVSHRDALLKLLREEGPKMVKAHSSESEFWTIYRLYQWEEKDYIILATELAGILDNLDFNAFTKDQLLGGLSRLKYIENIKEKFSNKNTYEKLITIAQNHLLNNTLKWYERSNSIGALVALSPERALVSGSKILADAKQDIELRARVYSAIEEGDKIMKKRLELKTPNDNKPENWKNWLENPEIKKLADKLSDV